MNFSLALLAISLTVSKTISNYEKYDMIKENDEEYICTCLFYHVGSIPCIYMLDTSIKRCND